MVEVDLLIFDLDGTLIDSLADIVSSTNHTLEQLGGTALNSENIRGFVGDGISVLLQRALYTQDLMDEHTLRRAVSLYTEHHDRHCLDHVTLVKGVRETLDYFNGKKLAIASNKSIRFTRKILVGLGIDSYFEVILGGDSLPVKKPDPAVLEWILERTGTDRTKSIMIGDGPQDIQCAKAAGVMSCGITSGFRPGSEINGADFLIGSVAELPGILN